MMQRVEVYDIKRCRTVGVTTVFVHSIRELIQAAVRRPGHDIQLRMTRKAAEYFGAYPMHRDPSISSWVINQPDFVVSVVIS